MCVCVCTHACVCICMCERMLIEACFDCVWVLCLVTGYVLHFGEISHKRVHYCYVMITFFFFSITTTLRVQPARQMWPSSPVSPGSHRVWCIAGTFTAIILSLFSSARSVSKSPADLSTRHLAPYYTCAALPRNYSDRHTLLVNTFQLPQDSLMITETYNKLAWWG